MQVPQSYTGSVPPYRTLLAVFIVGLLIGCLGRDLIGPAQAQIPNAGQQRLEMNQGLDQLNGKMAEVLSVLRNGTLKVRVVETDKNSSSGAARSSSDRSDTGSGSRDAKSSGRSSSSSAGSSSKR